MPKMGVFDFLQPIASAAGGIFGGPVGAAAGGILGGLLGGGGSSSSGGTSGTSSSTSNMSGTEKNMLPGATPLQAFGENQLLKMLMGYNWGSMPQLAGKTNQLFANVLQGGAPTISPQQTQLLEGQTSNFMQGLNQALEQYRKGAMSKAKQDALRRNIPLSDIARGQEANVDAQMMQQLAQGYTTAKGQELQNKLQYPFQNLNYIQGMAGLQNQYNQPFLDMLNQFAMSRLQGPRDVTRTGKTTTQGTQAGSTLSGSSGGIGDILSGIAGGADIFGQVGDILSMFGKKKNTTTPTTTGSGWLA